MNKVGLAYNLIPLSCIQELPLDCIAEYDANGTIRAVYDAFVAGGYEVILLEADQQFTDKLISVKPDIVFNIAEGLQGESREAQVPAICEFYNIPYTGSGIMAIALCQNKAYTNQVLSYNNFSIPPFQEFYSSDDELSPDLSFPLIVKLRNEGSSMGLTDKSVVNNVQELKYQVNYLIRAYNEPALVQKYIVGREFTVGILGNLNLITLPITESVFDDPYGIILYNLDKESLMFIEQTQGKGFLEGYNNRIIRDRSVCPAEISPDLATRINQTVVRAFRTLNCRDWCRIDLRVGNDNQIYILDVNPIAGISPGSWLPNSAATIGFDYPSFINRILEISIDRVQGLNRF